MLNKLKLKFREKQFKWGNQIDALESLHKQKKLFAWRFSMRYISISLLQYIYIHIFESIVRKSSWIVLLWDGFKLKNFATNKSLVNFLPTCFSENLTISLLCICCQYIGFLLDLYLQMYVGIKHIIRQKLIYKIWKIMHSWNLLILKRNCQKVLGYRMLPFYDIELKNISTVNLFCNIIWVTLQGKQD